MKGHPHAFSILAAGALALTATAAQARCGPTPQIEASLSYGYGESVVEEAVRAKKNARRPGNSFAVRLWANPQTQTWTLTVTDEIGNTCVLGSGRGVTSQPRMFDVMLTERGDL